MVCERKGKMRKIEPQKTRIGRTCKLAMSFKKCSTFLIAAILILSTILSFQYISPANTQPNPSISLSEEYYIVIEYGVGKLSMVSPDGVRTEIYTFAAGTGPRDVVVVSVPPPTAVTVSVSDITESSLKLTWTQSSDPFFARYKIFQSITQDQLGTSIGTITNIATTSQTVTDLSPETTYYFTVRIVNVAGLYADSTKISGATTALPFWKQTWFIGSILAIIAVIVVAIVLRKSKRTNADKRSAPNQSM